MSPLRLALLAVTVFLMLGACSSDEPDPEETSFQTEGRLAFLQPNGDTLRTIDIEIADTNEERQRGLMHRRSLGYDRGMLFIFDEVDDGGMWMRNTPLPLDIVFVAPDSQVINIARRTTPFSDETIEPAAPRKFVVEVRAGFADRFGLTDSTRIRWTRTD
jgi:uncharacterized membrane protein (UPF0127 family)